ncbi:DNA polymerase [Pseudomonas phage PhiPA3]|uniref:Uncharacterized protein 085 n=1 Tax=Pseudomonas phage PhiPA3 TaxID=998086 RepID=F8SJW4_BPPA3|nr:DNA polymerase [Pseudomonas phage PhiPA3]AEH03509.1 hypothetical protein [Pseudomonas phage PhiPA3]
MSDLQFTKEDVVGIEAKHITYVTDQTGRRHDAHVVKEIIHLKDKRRIPRIRVVEDYKRPFWITQKGRQNHKEKKDYEFERNLQKYTCTQLEMPRMIAKLLGDYSMGPNPRMRQLSRSPYLYGSDVSSVCCLKNDYREQYPELISRNTVAGGDIETNVYEEENEGQIICMSVTHKENVYLAYLKHWVKDLDDPVAETFAELERIPELVTLKKARNLNIEIEVVNSPADIIINCMRRLHKWKPDFFAFWNIDFDMSRILTTLENYGIDPKNVFSDPQVPPNYRYFHYRQDQAMTTTASGVTKSKGPEDQWHWITAPASFQCIDSMATYRVTRLAKGKESSYALDAILKKELSMDEQETVQTEEEFNSWMKKMGKAIAERSGAHPYWSVNDPSKDKVDVTYNDVPVYTAAQEKLLQEGIDPEDPRVQVEYRREEKVEREEHWEEVDSLVWGVNVHPGFGVGMRLNFGKLKFAETDYLGGIEWHIEMQKNHKVRYGLYNIIDSIRLEQLDEKINDLASSITLFSKSSDYKNFSSNPKRLCDDMHFWYLKRPEPCVIGSSSDQMVHDLDSYVVGHDSWIVTLPSYMAGPNGLKCVKDLPDYNTLLFTHVADLD